MEQFGPVFTEQFRICELNPEHVAAPGAACAELHTGVGATGRRTRLKTASVYHILHDISEEPARISRS